MEKLKQNKVYLIITSIVVLLPIIVGVLLWSKLPDEMATHWGADNVANGWSSKPFAVFGIPGILLAIHLICTFTTAVDPKRQSISDKIWKMVLLICPVVSIICSVSIYGNALSYQINVSMVSELVVGLLFIIIGNYLPKCRQNYTVGIKLPWTLADADNWNKTHRLAGIIWMIGGVVILLLAFIKPGLFVGVMIAILLMVFIPTVFSFVYYLIKQNKA